MLLKNKKKIILGLSGGVDSSVSLLLLLKQLKYNVECIFMRNWDNILNNDINNNENNKFNICQQEIDYNDAKIICEKLNIKLYKVNFVEQYWNYVFSHFISEFKKGRTPNPDILCNKFIKFNFFLKYAINNFNAYKIAMGHYAKVMFSKNINEYLLLRSNDLEKDQTYFLCKLNQNQLSKIIFPIGNLNKKIVRKIAQKKKLITGFKKDSTGICFIGERNFKKFLENYLPNKIGDIIDIDTNKFISKHSGIMYYTIGQNKGLNLGGMDKPYFVVGKNVKKNILYVSKFSDNKWLYSDSCIIIDINLINNFLKNKKNFFCTAKFRYRQKDIKVFVKMINFNKYLIIFSKKIRAITPGQEAVLYYKKICLGGGTIDSVYYKKKRLWYL